MRAKHQKLASDEVTRDEENPTSQKESIHRPCKCNPWYISSAVTFLVGVIGLTAVCFVSTHCDLYVVSLDDYTSSHSYGVGLDAGSSHTSLFVYKWSKHKHDRRGVEQILKCPKGYKQRPISSFADDPSKAGDDLKTCLDEAKRSVPKHRHQATPILLGATAGMRLLREANESAAEAIMTSVRNTIATYPFLFERRQQQVRILTGREEGTFSWIAINYLSGNFGFQTSSEPPANQHETVGSLDMGGASTEITFVPRRPTEIPRGYDETVQLYGTDYEVYSQSYKCYGLREAYRRYLANLVQTSNSRIVSDPCSWADYVHTWSYEDIFRVPCTLSKSTQSASHMKGVNFTFIGTDNVTACHSVVRNLFNMSAPCPYSRCSFNAVYQPSLFGQFVGFSGFYHTKEDLHLKKKVTTFEEFIAAVNNCTKILTPAQQNETNCFKVHFIAVLLTDGYGFNSTNWHSLRIIKKLKGVDLGFILGMMINMTNIAPSELTGTSSLSADILIPLFVLLALLFVAFLVMSFVCLCSTCQRRRQAAYQELPDVGTYGVM